MVRAVGTACATNPLPVVLPCHRVLRTDGTPGGYVGGPAAKTTLLNLEAAGEDVDEARDLAQANHLGARNIGDVALAEKRQQMVFAKAVEVDVLDDHHLVMLFVEHGVQH